MNEYTSVGSATYSYDADGNLTITAGAAETPRTRMTTRTASSR